MTWKSELAAKPKSRRYAVSIWTVSPSSSSVARSLSGSYERILRGARWKEKKKKKKKKNARAEDSPKSQHSRVSGRAKYLVFFFSPYTQRRSKKKKKKKSLKTYRPVTRTDLPSTSPGGWLMIAATSQTLPVENDTKSIAKQEKNPKFFFFFFFFYCCAF
jgi:hypothetical protein